MDTKAAKTTSNSDTSDSSQENHSKLETPIRVGIFPDISSADQVVENLLAADIPKQYIGIVCSERAVQKHFEKLKQESPAGTFTLENAMIGGTIGAALGGLSVVAGSVMTGGIALVTTAGIAAWAGGVVGGLIGAMSTRGIESEVADYYDQAVLNGKILVTVECDDCENRTELLATAEKVFDDAGAEPIPLPKG